LSEIPDTAEVLVDATGLRCPLPVIRLAQAAKGASAGTVITVLSTDPAAGPDIAAWCRMRGEELLAQTGEPDGRALRSQIRVRDTTSPAHPQP